MNYDRRVGSSGSFADIVRTFCEELAVSLQSVWGAASPRSRVVQKKPATEYTVEVSVGGQAFDRKVSLKLDDGVFKFVLEGGGVVGRGSISADISADGLAEVIRRSAGDDVEY